MDQNWRVTVWGTRGASPRAQAEYLEYGGNTSCISVRCGDELVVFDAGSGIVRLSDALESLGKPKRVHIFISHLHLDHILGLPNFSMLHDSAAEVHLYGEARDGLSFRAQLDSLLGPPHWPLGLEDYRARITVHELTPGQRVSIGEGLTVDSMRSNHPNQSLIYRLEGAGRRIVYTLDCELDQQLRPLLEDFAQDSSLLVWDANFTRADLQKGWGHSTWEQGLTLGKAANAKLTLMSHFSHQYTDEFLREQERLAKQDGEGVLFAKEGMVIAL